MPKQMNAQGLNQKHWTNIEQLADTVKYSSQRFSSYTQDTLQAIAYVLLKKGNKKPTQLDIEDASITVLAAKSKITKIDAVLLDLLAYIDQSLLSTKKAPEFTPSPLGDMLSQINPLFAPGTIASLDWENNKIPLQRTATPSGKCCLANNTSDQEKTNSEIYTKIFLYMIFGGKYPYANLLTESHIAKIITIRNTFSISEQLALQENVTTHFTQHAELKGNTGDFQQKIKIIFSGLNEVYNEFEQKSIN